MRCHYLSDLHLEAQSFDARLPSGDVLIVAGDLCHARRLDPALTDRYSLDQRARVMRFVDAALARFAHVLLIAGNHEHYDGVFEDTTGLLRRHLPGVTVLDNDTIEIGGIRFFGSTLWSDFEGRSETSMARVRRGMGEFFFVKTRRHDDALIKLQPRDILQAHDDALAALRGAVVNAEGRSTIVVTHHAPSRQGLNPLFSGNGLDGAYGSDLEREIEGLANVPIWVHGHTHIARSYRIGDMVVRSNALGFAAKGHGARGFAVAACFDL